MSTRDRYTAGEENDLPIRRYELTDHFAAATHGYSAPAVFVRFDGSDWTATSATLDVWSPRFNPGLDGDRGWCMWRPDSHKWEVITPERPILRGKLDGNLAVGGSATVSIWAYNGAAEVDTGFNVTAYDWLGLVALTGNKVFVEFEPAVGRWYVIVDSSRVLLGKTDASHAVDASGTVSIWGGTPGSESDTGINVTAYNRAATLASGKWCGVAHNGDGYILVWGRCA